MTYKNFSQSYLCIKFIYLFIYLFISLFFTSYESKLTFSKMSPQVHLRTVRDIYELPLVARMRIPKQGKGTTIYAK